MSNLYHGSMKQNLKVLEPRNSTHGKYLYATKEKILALIFSGKCSDDQTLSICKVDDKWALVERIPNGYKTMFNNSSSIYTLDDKTFKDINTSFSEVVSEQSVEVINEEKIDNVYNSIKECAGNGLISMYTYPNRPLSIPNNDIDLLNKEIEQRKRNNKEIDEHTFDRVVYLHPNLIEEANKELEKKGLNPYGKKDLVNIFEKHIVSKLVNPSHEEYLESAYLSIIDTYPDLISVLNDKVSILNKPNNEKLNYIIDSIAKYTNDVNVKDLKDKYIDDDRDVEQIASEIKNEIIHKR